MIAFAKATKRRARLRLALIGPSGSGKTYTALAIAQHLAKPVAVIDTEHGSASKYADVFDFDVLELTSFAPARYVEAIQAAEKAGYGTLVIDSLSHAWMGKDGALEMVDRAAKRERGNSFGAWRDVTPQHNALVEAILAAKLHVVVTMRTKTEYVQERDERTGKTVVRKLGLQPVQRDGLEYEFDVVGDLDVDNNLVIGKTRCSDLAGGVFRRAGKDVAGVLNAWLERGEGEPSTAVPHDPETGEVHDEKPAPSPDEKLVAVERRDLGRGDKKTAWVLVRKGDPTGTIVGKPNASQVAEALLAEMSDAATDAELDDARDKMVRAYQDDRSPWITEHQFKTLKFHGKNCREAVKKLADEAKALDAAADVAAASGDPAAEPLDEDTLTQARDEDPPKHRTTHVRTPAQQREHNETQ
jgi:hypothetical protein